MTPRRDLPAAAGGDAGRDEPTTVLDIGGAAPVVELPAGARVTALATADAPDAQLPQRYDIVVLSAQARRGDDGRRRAVLHTALQHLERNGRLLVLHGAGEAPLAEEPTTLDLHPTGRCRVAELLCSEFRRGDRRTVHDLLFDARRGLERLDATALAAQLSRMPAPLVIDTRTPTDRERFGTIAGSIHLPRTVVEWRSDPANGYLHPSITGFDQPLVLVCNHGYSSSLAAANLRQLGYRHVSDLIGGIHGWRAAGLPLVPPDHTFLELG